jgi:hypothetical protein
MIAARQQPLAAKDERPPLRFGAIVAASRSGGLVGRLFMAKFAARTLEVSGFSARNRNAAPAGRPFCRLEGGYGDAATIHPPC